MKGMGVLSGWLPSAPAAAHARRAKCTPALGLPASCHVLQGHFPEPEHDPVIQIASLVTEFGKKQPAVRNIMTLKSCAPITGAGAWRTVACGMHHAPAWPQVPPHAPFPAGATPLPAAGPVLPAEVMSFDDEKALLLRWRDLVLEADPDIIIGYNIVNFDLPYLLNRADTLKIPQFWTWGRLRNRCRGFNAGRGCMVPA